MIRIFPNDLLAIEHEGRYFYAIVLEGSKVFGAQLSYVFHLTSETLISSEGILDEQQPGFYAYVDYIWCKREKRVTRYLKNTDTSKYKPPVYSKGTNNHRGKNTLWWIYDQSGQEIERTTNLSEEQKQFPINEKIDEYVMFERVLLKWTLLKNVETGT